MIVAIIVAVYWFIGFCYTQAMPKQKFPFEWVANLIFAPLWPYIMLKTFFQFQRLMMKKKLQEK